MKVGLKLWSTNPAKYVEEAGFADFIEVLPVNLESVEKFANKNYEYTIHVPHERFGFSPILDMRKSRKLLELSAAAAKRLKAELIVMHAGYTEKEPDEAVVHEAIKAAAMLAKSASHGRILIENSSSAEICESDKGRHYICYDYAQLKEMLEISGAGFCLDLEHAAITAKAHGEDYKKYITQLMKLKPEYFHLSGTKLTIGHHLSLFETAMDLNFVKSLLKKANKPVCLETPIGTEQRKKEVEFLKS